MTSSTGKPGKRSDRRYDGGGTGPLEIRVNETPWWNGFEVAFFQRSGDKVWIGEPVTMREIPHGGLVDQPTARVSREAAQGLFNELWRLGFRPKDGTGNGGHVEAVKYHLEDMRRLVFARGEIPDSVTPARGKS